MKIENYKLKIVFFGTPHFVIPVLETLIKNFSVACVVTASDAIVGRKKLLTPSPVKQYCINTSLQIPVLTPQQFSNITIQQLQELHPDLFVVAAYGKIIPKTILDITKYGALNIHPTLLPKYRGPSPIQTTILHGERESGITIIKMDEKMDHGPILAQEKIALKPDDTFESLHKTMFQQAAKMLPETIQDFVKGKLQPEEQNHKEATYCKIISRQDGYFDSNSPPSPEQLDRIIRAYYPWPTAWTRIRSKNHELRIMKFLPEGYVQLEGGKPMKLHEFLNGNPEMLEKIEKIFGIIIPNS